MVEFFPHFVQPLIRNVAVRIKLVSHDCLDGAGYAAGVFVYGKLDVTNMSLYDL